MADTKITALTALTAADPANDVIPIVDVSDTTMAASGTTKKISVNNILSSSPTASGALTVTGLVTAGSAAITGAATVGTTLGVTGVSTLTGAVGVGATPIGKFDVYAVASDTNIFIRSDTDKSGQIVFRDNLNAGNSGKVRYDHLNERLSFAADGAENLYLLSTGDLSLIAGNVVVSNGKGIDFSATAGTGTSEILNDYEEGTWTGTITGSTTNPTIPVTATGRYTKVGRQVSVQIAFEGVSTVGASGNVGMSGLPFANTALRSVGTAGTFTGATFTGTLISVIGASSNLIEFYGVVSNSSWGAATHNASASTYFWVNITYTV